MLLANIKAFTRDLIAKHSQLAPWLEPWQASHETQINIDPTDLEPGNDCEWWGECEGDRYQVRPIRIPHGSNTLNPEFRDRPVRGPIHRHWLALGTTGWDWEQRRSMWVGFDYDAIEGHAKGRGIEADQLQEIRSRALSLRYVTARTSTGGRGLHLIVPLNPLPTTRTHTEHSALAKDVLIRMSTDCGYPLHEGVDCRGLILWHWRKGITSECLKRIS